MHIIFSFLYPRFRSPNIVRMIRRLRWAGHVTRSEEDRSSFKILTGQEEWRRLHNEELHSLYRSPNIVRVIKNRKLRWAGHVVRMEEGKIALNF